MGPRMLLGERSRRRPRCEVVPVVPVLTKTRHTGRHTNKAVDQNERRGNEGLGDFDCLDMAGGEDDGKFRKLGWVGW
jgi:hypothetical protein